MKGFAVEPGALGATSPELHGHGNELQNIHNTLVQGLQAEGEPWGTDEGGRMFASKYLPRMDTTLSHSHALAPGMHSAGDGTAQWSTNLLKAGQADLQSTSTLLS